MPRKYGVGQELAQVPIPLKIASLSLSALLTNCRSQLVSGLRREKLKSNAILFVVDSFQAHLIALMSIHLYTVALGG